jgi:hypothetical protein
MEPNEWTRSSRCTEGGGNCVEVFVEDRGGVFMRDRHGCETSYTRAEFDAFIAGVKAGEFDLPA